MLIGVFRFLSDGDVLSMIVDGMEVESQKLEITKGRRRVRSSPLSNLGFRSISPRRRNLASP